MFTNDWKKEIFSIPNLLSLFRLLLIPVYVVIYLNATTPDAYFLSAAILAVSCLTDMIDGQIARRFNMITTVGKVLDPFADKVTQFTLVICLAIKHPALWFLAALIFVKEILQLIAAWVNLKKGRMLKAALMAGKICTTVLFVSLILMVMVPTLPETVIHIIAIIDAVFLIIAFADYAIAYFKKESEFLIIHNNEKEPGV
jgi:cardiolipin synthase